MYLLSRWYTRKVSQSSARKIMNDLPITFQELGLRAAILYAGLLTSYAFGSVRIFSDPFCCSFDVNTPVMGCWHSEDNGRYIGHSSMEMVGILILEYSAVALTDFRLFYIEGAITICIGLLSM